MKNKIFTGTKNEALRKQSHIITQKKDVDGKIEKLTNKITAAKLSVGEFESESSNGNEKINSNQEKLNAIIQSLETLERQKIKLERIIQNHKHSVSEINSRIKNSLMKK